MWGGDEFLLVLPAWLALEAAQLFFEHCRISSPDNEPQTHSTVLVFAHHNAPIGPLQRLARSLAEQGKQGLWKNQDSLHTLVLESFDHAGGDLGTYWARRGLPGLSWEGMALNPTALKQLLALWPQVASYLPMRSLHRIVDGLRRWEVAGDNEKRLITRAYANVSESLAGPAREAWQALWTVLLRQASSGQSWPDTPGDTFVTQAHLPAWLTLVELSDYLPTTAPVHPAEEIHA